MVSSRTKKNTSKMKGLVLIFTAACFESPSGTVVTSNFISQKHPVLQGNPIYMYNWVQISSLRENSTLTCLTVHLADENTFVNCEVCTHDGDCTVTYCGDGWRKICEHPNPEQGIKPDGGTCTCKRENASCSTAEQCAHTGCVGTVYCIDGRCLCYGTPRD